MPGTLGAALPSFKGGPNSLGQMYPGGVYQIVANTLASPTVVSTVAAHGLATGDTIFWTNSTTSNPALTTTPQTVVTVLSPTTFSLVGINCSTAGTAGAYDYAILSAPVTGVGVPATVNVGTCHGLRVGDTVTIVASGSTPSLDGAQVVTAVPTANSFQVGAVTNLTVAASTTAAHYTKTTFYSDAWDTSSGPDFVGLVLTSVIGTTPNTTLCDIQATIDNVNWFNVGYATMAAPQTPLFAQLTITTAVATSYKLIGPGEIAFIPYQRVRLKFTSSTNIIVSAVLNAQRGNG